MSSALTKTTVGACLAAVPVFVPIAVAPGVTWGEVPSPGHTVVALPPTRYVMVQATRYLVAHPEHRPVKKRKPIHRNAKRATLTTRTNVLAGGLDGLEAPPAAATTAYESAASVVNGTSDCNLSWAVLAGIGEVESHHAASGGSGAPNWDGIARPRIVGPKLDGAGGTHPVPDTDGGSYDGDRHWDHAVGPMQFLPSTWATYGIDADGDGVADPQDIRDAALAAARYLCHDGADLSNPQQLAEAVYSYNHANWYVSDVLSLAARYANGSTPIIGPAKVVSAAVAFAYNHLGDPYLWGGTGPLYDCSGFTQAAFASAGVGIPRTSEDQWLRLPHVDDGQLRVGDLVFFNPGEFRSGLPGHVGIYLGNGYMIDDPHTGAWVRVTPISGAGVYVGAARPAALAAGATVVPTPVPQAEPTPAPTPGAATGGKDPATATKTATHKTKGSTPAGAGPNKNDDENDGTKADPGKAHHNGNGNGKARGNGQQGQHPVTVVDPTDPADPTEPTGPPETTGPPDTVDPPVVDPTATTPSPTATTVVVVGQVHLPSHSPQLDKLRGSNHDHSSDGDNAGSIERLRHGW